MTAKGGRSCSIQASCCFEMRIFRQRDKIHRIRTFAHDFLEAIQVLLQLRAAFQPKGHRGQTARLGYRQGKFRRIADPGHGALNKRILGSQGPGGGVLCEPIQFLRGLPAETLDFLEESRQGLAGRAAEPFGECCAQRRPRGP